MLGTMDIEALLTRVYDWVASAPALRLDQAHKFDMPLKANGGCTLDVEVLLR
jgi:hypothetical protein